MGGHSAGTTVKAVAAGGAVATLASTSGVVHSSAWLCTKFSTVGAISVFVKEKRNVASLYTSVSFGKPSGSLGFGSAKAGGKTRSAVAVVIKKSGGAPCQLPRFSFSTLAILCALSLVSPPTMTKGGGDRCARFSTHVSEVASLDSLYQRIHKLPPLPSFKDNSGVSAVRLRNVLSYDAVSGGAPG